MSIDERFLNVIQALYDAAIDDGRWTEALNALTAVTGSQAATFWVLDGSHSPRLPILRCFNFDPAFMEDYQNNGMVPLDPTVRYLVTHPNEPIVHDGLVITEREKDRHAYYDWHHRWSDTRYRLIGQSQPAPHVQAGVALHRVRSVGRYDTGDIGQFALLHQHLQRALAIALHLGTLGTLHQCTTELLDRHAAAIVLLDEHQRVVYVNQRAIELDSQRDGVTIANRTLSLSDGRDNTQFRALIAQAIGRGFSSPAAAVMRVARPSGKRSYGVFVTPIGRDYPALSAVRPAVCVMVTDPDRRDPSLTLRLRAMFGLTDAEARLADALATGDDLRAAAARLGITYGTARRRLADIFQKTSTHRQGELVSLLLAVASSPR